MATRTVAFTFTDAKGMPLHGYVSFYPSVRVVDTTGNVLLEPVETRVPLDSTGSGSVSLFCTDSAGSQPVGWTYKVVGSWAGSFGPFNIEVPTGAGTLRLEDLAPVDYSTGVGITKGDKGDKGDQGIQGVAGVHVAPGAPTDTSLLWVDTDDPDDGPVYQSVTWDTTPVTYLGSDAAANGYVTLAPFPIPAIGATVRQTIYATYKNSTGSGQGLSFSTWNYGAGSMGLVVTYSTTLSSGTSRRTLKIVNEVHRISETVYAQTLTANLQVTGNTSVVLYGPGAASSDEAANPVSDLDVVSGGDYAAAVAAGATPAVGWLNPANSSSLSIIVNAVCTERWEP